VFSTEQWIFQDGNAPTAVQWKQENNILGMTWPAQSPAINVIENIWRYMKIRLPQVVHRIKLIPHNGRRNSQRLVYRLNISIDRYNCYNKVSKTHLHYRYNDIYKLIKTLYGLNEM
jgi:hypothetical protein